VCQCKCSSSSDDGSGRFFFCMYYSHLRKVCHRSTQSSSIGDDTRVFPRAGKQKTNSLNSAPSASCTRVVDSVTLRQQKPKTFDKKNEKHSFHSSSLLHVIFFLLLSMHHIKRRLSSLVLFPTHPQKSVYHAICQNKFLNHLRIFSSRIRRIPIIVR